MNETIRKPIVIAVIAFCFALVLIQGCRIATQSFASVFLGANQSTNVDAFDSSENSFVVEGAAQQVTEGTMAQNTQEEVANTQAVDGATQVGETQTEVVAVQTNAQAGSGQVAAAESNAAAAVETGATTAQENTSETLVASTTDETGVAATETEGTMADSSEAMAETDGEMAEATDTEMAETADAASATDTEEVMAEGETADDAAAVETVAVEEVDEGPRFINAPYTIYKNTLTKGWQDRSTSANINFNGFPAYDGLTAMTISFGGPDSQIYLYTPTSINMNAYTVLRFWINGGINGGQQISVGLIDENDNIVKAVPLTSPYPNNWRQIDVLIEDLGAPQAVKGIAFLDDLGQPQPVFFVDEVAFVDDPLAGQFKESEVNGPSLTIHAETEVHEINDLIYGMNFADENLALELDLPVNRWGGNAVTRYNYLEDATNAGNNWYFQNIPPEKPASTLPRNSSADKFIQQNNRTETETIMTIPLIGWIARADYTCGYSIEKYGDQIEVDEWRDDCGGGVLVDGTVLLESDPTDTSIKITPTFVQGWIRHLVAQFDDAASETGVRFYSLDNEPMLWSHTHRDVHPQPLDTDTFWELTVAYARAIKDIDPTSQIVGPVFWGWTSFFWSDIDVSDTNDPKISAPDREAHDNLPLAVWYLREMARYEEENGVRLLDYFDLHFYPQQVGVAYASVGDEATQALRLRSTRSLWDPNYVDESWIGEPVYLIPRMQEWVDEYYPGTQTAVTEYNWGGLEHINGAVAQADVLGIFGREGLDMANLWGPPEPDQPGFYAFRMYRNYDGQKSKFGDMSLLAESTNQDQLAVFAARRQSDGAYTVMVVNKTSIPLTSPIELVDYDGPDGLNVYRYSNANLNAIERLPSAEIDGAEMIYTFEPWSITLFVAGE